jgi:hypothetical protein
MKPLSRKALLLLGNKSTLLKGLAHAWKLDEESGTRYASAGGRDLTNYASVGSAYTRMGQASSFIARANTYLYCSDHESLRFGNETFEITAVFRPMSLGKDHWIVAKWRAVGGGREYCIIVSTLNMIQFIVRNPADSVTTTVEAVTCGAVVVGKSYFIDVYHDAVNDRLGISVNGGAFDTVNYASGVRSSTNEFRIGCRGDGVATSYIPNGEISDVYMWRRLLTDSERREHYNSGKPLRYPFRKHVTANGALTWQQFCRNLFAARTPSQRREFYAQGRYWLFSTRYDKVGTDGASLYYTSSTDGEEWEEPAFIVDIPYADAQWNVEVDGSKLHICKNIQKGASPPGVHEGLEYRRGSLGIDGSLTWDAAWQTVIAIGSFVGDFSIAITADGAVWVGYADSPSGDAIVGNARVVRNSALDGTWVTAVGFPATVQAGTVDDANALIVPLTVSSIYAVVHEWNQNIQANGHIVASDGTVTAEGAITASAVEATSGGSAKVARIGALGLGDGYVHIGYQTTGAEIKYARRNSDTTLEAEVLISGSGNVEKAISSPVLAMNNAGEIFMVWTTSTKVFECKFDTLAWGSVITVAEDTLDSAYEHVSIPRWIETSKVPVTWLTSSWHVKHLMIAA